MWDNHEFSWLGWQSLQKFEGKTRPAQTRKVAAKQAFFEYRPSRMPRPNSKSLERFEPPHVVDTAVTSFDEHGLGTEPNNLIALRSLKGYRAIRCRRARERPLRRHLSGYRGGDRLCSRPESRSGRQRDRGRSGRIRLGTLDRRRTRAAGSLPQPAWRHAAGACRRVLRVGASGMGLHGQRASDPRRRARVRGAERGRACHASRRGADRRIWCRGNHAIAL